MSELNRRRFFGMLAATMVAGVGAARYTLRRFPPPTGPPQVIAAASAAEASALLPPPPPSTRVKLPGGGVLTRLPGDGDLLALTVDDGVSSDVVRLYTQFAKDTGLRLTFFVNRPVRTFDALANGTACLSLRHRSGPQSVLARVGRLQDRAIPTPYPTVACQTRLNTTETNMQLYR